MRMDLGNRAHVLMDARVAAVAEFKHVEERYNLLMKYAL
jgi:hypothetical protein